jgi:hypothetical protein
VFFFILQRANERAQVLLSLEMEATSCHSTNSLSYAHQFLHMYKRHLKLSLFNEPHSHSFSSAARAHTGSCGSLPELVVQLGHITHARSAQNGTVFHACPVCSAACTKMHNTTRTLLLSKSLTFLSFHGAARGIFNCVYVNSKIIKWLKFSTP